MLSAREDRRLGRAPAGDQQACPLAVQPMRPLMVAAVELHRFGKRILESEHRRRQLILLAQCGFEGFPGDNSQCDQVIADMAGISFSARQRTFDVSRGRESLATSNSPRRINILASLVCHLQQQQLRRYRSPAFQGISFLFIS